MVEKNRVFITSIGIITPMGAGYTETSEALNSDRTGLGEIMSFDASAFPSRLAAEARENGKVVQSEHSTDRREIFFEKAFSQLPLTEIFSCYEQEERVLSIGTGIEYFDLPGYVSNSDRSENYWGKYSSNFLSFIEARAENALMNKTPVVNLSACVASSQAMGYAFRMVKRNPEKLVVAGGVDSMLNPLHYMGFYKLGALSTWEGPAEKSCKPFDRDRCGLVLGEGAALYTFESERNCRGREILAEITGYSSTMDAYMATAPQPEGKYLALAALNAIKESGISPDDIDCIHAHGTGTLKNDITECKAIKVIFGDRYSRIPVFSMKSRIGHLIGSCGAAEFSGIIYSLLNQIVPQTVNFENKDDEIDLNVLKEPLETKIKYILKLNAAFGGQNTAIVVKKYE